MASPVNVLYEFGPFQLDPPERLLVCDGKPVSLPPKAFDLLLALVDRSGHLVEKDELLRIVWPASFVEEGNLAVTISLVRKTLNDDRGQHKYIETVSKRGYRFVAEVKRLDDRALVIAGGTEAEKLRPRPVLPRATAQETTPATSDLPIRKRFGALELAIVAIGLLALAVVAITYRKGARTQSPGGAPIRSLAVLPFQTLSSNSSDKYLGLGMADAVITKLANTGKVIVRPTSAIQQYAGTQLTPQSVGREQGVDAVLDGRIQREGSRVRVTMQLIRVQDGMQLWANTFDRQFTDVFALEDAISRMAAQSIRLHLTGEESRRFTKRSTENLDAYDAYMKGRYFWNKRTDSGLNKGLDYFRQAIKLDPGFADAYVGIADSYATLGLYSVLPPKQAFPAAKDAATRALQMDDSLAAAHATLGFIYFYYEWNVSASGDEFHRALAENPDYAMAHSWYGESLAATGRYSEAIAEAQRAIQDDPLSLIVGSNAGWTFALAGHYDQSVEILKKTIEIDPNFPRTHFRLGQVYEEQGQYPMAILEFEKAVHLSGGDPYYEGSLGHAYGVAGNSNEARSVLQKLQARVGQQYLPPYAIGLVYAGLGDKDQAFRWLQKAVEDRSTSMVFLRTDPELASLRSDSRFAQLSRLVNF
jgi:DNA-binding winged helix-turn-helix (wHTH) protein/TolB-like protein/Flp pilus assembly protein TadD